MLRRFVFLFFAQRSFIVPLQVFLSRKQTHARKASDRKMNGGVTRASDPPELLQTQNTPKMIPAAVARFDPAQAETSARASSVYNGGALLTG